MTCLFLKPCSRVLCLPGQNASAAPGKEAEKAPGSRREHHQALRTAYLSDVQRALDKSSYSQFYEALLTYKKTDNYDAMVSVIAALTTERPQDFHLLQSKSFFKNHSYLFERKVWVLWSHVRSHLLV